MGRRRARPLQTHSYPATCTEYYGQGEYYRGPRSHPTPTHLQAKINQFYALALSGSCQTLGEMTGNLSSLCETETRRSATEECELPGAARWICFG